jgi:ABC-type branched-subunit amino acid transport system substrate-binding protein
MLRLTGALLAGLLAFAVHAENGVTADQILIGQSAPYTGHLSEQGNRMNVGIRAYFDFINTQGGINGRKLQLVASDDGSDPERTVTNTKTLITNDKVFALLGYVGTPTTEAAIPVITAARIPLIGPVSGAPSLRDPPNRYVFHIRASYLDEAEKIVEQLSTIGQKNLAVVYEDDGSGRAGLEGMTKALAKRNLKLAGSAVVDPGGKSLTKALALLPGKPDAVILVSGYTSAAAFIRAAKKAGYTGQFMNMSLVGARALAEELGRDGVGVMVSQVVPFPFGGGTALAREYNKNLPLIGYTDFDFTSFEGWIAAKVLVEGIRRAGRTLTRENLMSALESMNNFDLGGFPVSFTGRDHAASKFVELTIIAGNGKFQK